MVVAGLWCRGEQGQSRKNVRVNVPTSKPQSKLCPGSGRGMTLFSSVPRATEASRSIDESI